MSSEEPLSDAVLTALAWPDALPIHRAVPWPPARVTRAADHDLAAQIRYLGNIGWGHEPAAIALAELADDAEAAITSRYHAFIRAVIDPAFPRS